MSHAQPAKQNVAKTKKSGVAKDASLMETDHINIDGSSRHRLGQLLSTRNNMRFTHPIYGPFNTLDGFWYWMRVGEPKAVKEGEEVPDRDRFRRLVGSEARGFLNRFRVKSGKELKEVEAQVVLAMYYKIVQNERLYQLLIESTLPFKNYYIFGPKKLPINAEHAPLICRAVTLIRDHLKTHGKDVAFVYEGLSSN